MTMARPSCGRRVGRRQCGRTDGPKGLLCLENFLSGTGLGRAGACCLDTGQAFPGIFGPIGRRRVRPLPALGDFRSPVTLERGGLRLSLTLRRMRPANAHKSAMHCESVRPDPATPRSVEGPEGRCPFSLSLENLPSSVTLEWSGLQLSLTLRRMRPANAHKSAMHCESVRPDPATPRSVEGPAGRFAFPLPRKPPKSRNFGTGRVAA